VSEDGKPYNGPRRRPLSPTVRMDIGRELVAAREQGIDWKDLMAKYGMGRTRLWMLWRDAKNNVHEHNNNSQPASDAPLVASDAAPSRNPVCAKLGVHKRRMLA